MDFVGWYYYVIFGWEMVNVIKNIILFVLYKM